MKRLLNASMKQNDTRFAGDFYRHESARLWTVPAAPPPVQVWAGGPVTARRAGRVTDGIVVQARQPEQLTVLRDAFLSEAAESERDRRLLTVHVQVSWAQTDDSAMKQALKEWPMVGLRFPRGDIRSPFDVDQLVRSVSESDLRSRMVVTSDIDRIRAQLQSYLDLGFNSLHVQNVGRNQEEWLEVAARELLPKLEV
jgi:coenzyme F420-dependent glucose-6-phosphate dehydrogenase